MGLLPVVLRLEPGEVLVSWLHRIAAIYGMELRDIFGTGIRYRDLAISPDAFALQAICEATRIEPCVARLHTFYGYCRGWPDHWATRWIIFNGSIDGSSYDPAPWMQVCTRCLQEDREYGVQFLRLRWLSAAATFCQRHREPLLDCCTRCARACQLGGVVCPHCGCRFALMSGLKSPFPRFLTFNEWTGLRRFSRFGDFALISGLIWKSAR